MGGAALESAAYAVDTVVGLLGRKALQGEDDVLVLLADQIVGAVFLGEGVVVPALAANFSSRIRQ